MLDNGQQLILDREVKMLNVNMPEKLAKQLFQALTKIMLDCNGSCPLCEADGNKCHGLLQYCIIDQARAFIGNAIVEDTIIKKQQQDRRHG